MNDSSSVLSGGVEKSRSRGAWEGSGLSQGLRALVGLPKKVLKKVFYSFVVPSGAVYLNTRKDLSAYEIGDWSFGHLNVRSWKRGGSLKIGRYCALAKGVTVYLGGEHRIDWVTTYPFATLFGVSEGYPEYARLKGDVVIGNDVWIGEDAVIMSGVTIGDGAVIGARSVVRRNVAAYAIVAGNPATMCGFRFEKELIRALEEIAWWNWDIEKAKEAWPYLLSGDVAAFVAKYGKKTECTSAGLGTG